MKSAAISRRTVLIATALTPWAAAGTRAQSSAEPSQGQSPVEPGKGLGLTTAQRELIYASVSKQTHKSTAAPPVFNATVGGTVPPSIELSPLPETIVAVVPQVQGHACAFIASQVLLVEPKARRIVEIIGKPG
jgi:hypothetical protein